MTWCNGCAMLRSRWHVRCYRLWISYGWILPFLILGSGYPIARLLGVL